MPETRGSSAAAWIVRHEAWLVFLLGTLAFVSIPLSLGRIGVSWDMINHHVYLGWTAFQPRFHLDYLAAGYQGYQFPYLYWPVYKAAMLGLDGAAAGTVLALLHACAIPAVWLIARQCIAGTDLFAAGMRTLAVALAFLSAATLSLFDSTSNDLLAATPLLYAYAVALRPLSADRPGDPLRSALLSGALAGVAVAFKLSNGFLVLALPLLWLCAPGPFAARAGRSVVAGICLLACFLLVYGYWGWQLWTHFGSPVYPLYDHWFEPVRAALGWRR